MMGDSSRKDRSIKKTKTSIGCLLLRKSRRRATSEPPKGKREKSCSPRTLKPRKIPRDDGYPEARTSESDSGFLSFESVGSKHSNVSNLLMSRENRSSGSIARLRKHEKDDHLKCDYDLGNDTPPLLEGANEQRAYDEPDIVDLNDNFGEFVEDDQRYKPDEIAIEPSGGICSQCGCLPRIFRLRGTQQNTNRASSAGSYTQKLEDSLFDLRGSDLLRTISDLRSSITEGSSCSEDQCFLKLVYNEHRCVDPSICHKAKFAALNAHLRTLVQCMPRSFCECESKRTWTNYILNEKGYMSQRRNAVCETKDRNREMINKAVCSYMTLKALLRYDLL